jgi:hypothetical protein
MHISIRNNCLYVRLIAQLEERLHANSAVNTSTQQKPTWLCSRPHCESLYTSNVAKCEPSLRKLTRQYCGKCPHTRVLTKLVCMICFLVKESDSDTVIMVIILVVGVGGIFLLFAIMALCYR